MSDPDHVNIFHDDSITATNCESSGTEPDSFYTMCYVIGICAMTMVAVINTGCSSQPKRSQKMILLLQQEIEAGLNRRGIRENYERYQLYCNDQLRASERDRTFSDKTGNCRLNWYNDLMHDQLTAPAELNRFSWQLRQTLQDESSGVVNTVNVVADTLDMDMSTLPPAVCFKGEPPLVYLQQIIGIAYESFDASMATLSKTERQQLRQQLYDVTTEQVVRSGAFIPQKNAGRQMCDLLEKIDRNQIRVAARSVAMLTDPRYLSKLQHLSHGTHETLLGVTGELRDVVNTPNGLILVGESCDNVYDLDILTGVCAVVDLGGDDIYMEGTVSTERPVFVLIDLTGDDTYHGTQPGVQGAGVCGVSILIDDAGDDSYTAMDVAQGASLCGVGMLIDSDGDDVYRGQRRVHGSAMGGIALLLDRTGNDSYHAALYAQGFGGPLGFGLLVDQVGNDQYYAGGLYAQGYPDTPGYDGWSQGVGAGVRGVANGGIGVLLDDNGDDIYECDYFSHGGGYWFAVGIARDFSGNDQRLGATRLAYDDGPRSADRFLRWGIGWQAHYAIGVVIDDQGHDSYGGNMVGLGFSWDIGLAALIDLGGNDQYLVKSSAQGQGRQAAFGILYDVGGDDQYAGESTGIALPDITYHPMPSSGGNFSFAIDYLGRDLYNSEVFTDVDLVRESPNGFLVNYSFLPEPRVISRPCGVPPEN